MVIWIANHLAIATHVYCFYFILVFVCFLFIALYSVCNSKSFGLTISIDSFLKVQTPILTRICSHAKGRNKVILQNVVAD